MKESNATNPKWKIPFFTIWIGQALSIMGSTVTQFALVWYLTSTTGSATVLATASMMALLPGIILGPFIGALIDRWNRRVVMIAADSIIALSIFWLAYLFWADTLQTWQVYLVMFVRAVGGSFHLPAMQASTSLMVPREHLARVAGINQMLSGLMNIIGAPLGALLLELLPMYNVMLVDVITAGLAIAPLFFVSIPQPKGSNESDDQKQNIWADMGDGFRYLRGWSGLMALIGFAMVIKIALTPAISLIPLLVFKHFGGGAVQLSMVEAALGVGVILGGLLLSIWGGFNRKIVTIMTSLIIFSLSFVLLGLSPAAMFGLALISMFVMGLMLPMIDGPVTAIMQASVAPEMQGRIFTLMNSLLNITGPVSLVFAGPLSDLVGLQVWYVATGIICVVLGISAFFIPALMKVEENNQGALAVKGKSPA